MKYQINSFMANLPRLHWLLLAVLLNLVAKPVFADTQLVEIGRYTSTGNIALQLPKFQERFADGTRISEIKVAKYNGNLVVKLKGYSASGDCRTEIAPIMNSSGQIIPSTSVTSVGTRVFFTRAIKTDLLRCSDDGCHDLEGVDGLNGVETLSAKCDQTELSGNRCKCHVVTTESVETELVNMDLCNSWLEAISSPVSDWIRLQYIQ